MNKQNNVEQCVGRFRFQVPVSLVVTGRSQSIYDVDVSTLSVPPGGIKALWDERLTRIQGLTPPREYTQSLVHSFDLQPDVRGVWYFSNPYNPKLREIDAIKPMGKYAVLVVTGGEAGKEALVERLVTNVLNSYSESQSHGFCVGKGAVTSEPGWDEKTLVSLKRNGIDEFKITFATQTVEQPDDKTYSDVDEEKHIIAAGGGSITVLRDQTRSAAGLTGKEIWTSVTLPGKPPFVRFTWHFPGVSQDAQQPMINIKATAPTANQTELQVAWDQIMQSLERVPLPK